MVKLKDEIDRQSHNRRGYKEERELVFRTGFIHVIASVLLARTQGCSIE
jgi:hypothetical protein